MTTAKRHVTFLLTDVEGSTKLWERHPTPTSAAMRRHDAMAVDVASRHDGTLVKPRGEGDSLFLVFGDTTCAVRAAHDLQRRFHEEPWPGEARIRVRMAVHVGPAEERDGDYYGPSVNRCARLRSLAHGGQILLTQSAADAVGNTPAAGLSLLPLGSHALRDIDRPENVFQLLGPGLPSEFPELRSPEAALTNLPYRRNPGLVGRDDVLAQVHGALSSSDRLPVALVGITGIGKTQVAVEYAHRHLNDYPCGVYWLAASDTERLIHEMAALGRLLGVPEVASAEDRAGRVRDALQRLAEPSLVVLDNVVADADLRFAPTVGRCRVLVTTVHRHLVRRGFHVVAPAPLDEDSSVRLLRGTGGQLSDAEFAAARDIAARLGYLPLALALVANHVDRLALSFVDYRASLAAGPMGVLARARRRFTSDTGHDGSIYDAIRISYDGLDDESKSLLRTASFFAGKGVLVSLLFAASAVQTHDAFDEALADLVDHCLVEREQDGRLTVHELVREFARSDATADDARHMAAEVGRALQEALAAANSARDWSGARSELPHALTVAQFCRTLGAREELRGLAIQLGAYALDYADAQGALGWFTEAYQLACDLLGAESEEAAHGLRELGWARAEVGDLAGAREAAQHALDTAVAAVGADDPRIAEYENSLGYVLRVAGDLAGARPHYERAVAVWERAHGRNNPTVARYLNNIGTLLEAQGDTVQAYRHLSDALEIDQAQSGAPATTIAIRLNNIGRVSGKLGDWEGALTCHRNAAALHESAYGRQHPDVAASLCFAGRACRMLGDDAAARAYLQEADLICRRFFDAARPPLCVMVEEELGRLPNEGRAEG